jgi:hypothetical protein
MSDSISVTSPHTQPNTQAQTSAEKPKKDPFGGPTGTIWYLLYCKAKEESKAVMHLANQHVEAFYPKVMVIKVLRGKRQTVEEPLFPNSITAHIILLLSVQRAVSLVLSNKAKSTKKSQAH